MSRLSYPALEGDGFAQDIYAVKLGAREGHRGVAWIFGAEDKLAFLGVVVYPLKRRLVLYDDYRYFTVFHSRLTLDENEVAVKNSRAYHTVAVRGKAEVCIKVTFGGKR